MNSEVFIVMHHIDGESSIAVAAFSTREKAERYVKLMGPPREGEFEIDALKVDAVDR